MKKTLAAGLVGLSLSFGLMAAPAMAQALSVETTPIADLAAKPETKAILDKNIPELTAHPAFEQFKAMSLTQLQPMSQGALTDAQIAAVKTDLEKLPK